MLDAVTGRRYVGLGYIDPDLTNAGVTKVEAPDATTLVVTNTDPSDRILQMYIPILPKHIWEDQTLESIPTFAQRRAGRRQRAVPGGRVEDRRSSPGSSGTRTTGARRAPPTRSSSSSTRPADTMVQALKGGDLDYALGINSDQFDSLKARTGHRHRQRRDERLDDAQHQQLRQGHPGRRRLHQGPARPGLPRRPRLRHRQATS